ncbi:MAG: TM2 domain-containing protein [Chloroflexota bacterium]|nr:TM2 domain-containing protein [Chloroflexota bacterium]
MATANSEKSFVTAILSCYFMSRIGIHRFYVGKSGTGVLMLLSLGGLGIWSIIDFVTIVTGNFSDSNGLIIKN